jgi:hypothetical protein
MGATVRYAAICFAILETADRVRRRKTSVSYLKREDLQLCFSARE